MHFESILLTSALSFRYSSFWKITFCPIWMQSRACRECFQFLPYDWGYSWLCVLIKLVSCIPLRWVVHLCGNCCKHLVSWISRWQPAFAYWGLNNCNVLCQEWVAFFQVPCSCLSMLLMFFADGSLIQWSQP